MGVHMRLLSMGVAGLVLALGQIAEAQDGTQTPPPDDYVMEPPAPGYPVAFTQRPLTMPAMTLRGDLGFQLVHFDLGPFADSDFTTGLGAGVGFGIIDDLEVGIGGSSVAPTLLGVFASSGLRGLGGVLSPELARGFVQPEIYGRYRFYSSDMVEVGAELGLSLPTDDADVGLSLGVPTRLRFGDSFALDLALVLFMSFGEDGMGDRDTAYTLLFNIAPRYAMQLFYVGLDTGFTMLLEDPELTFIPFGLEVGATFGVGQAMVVDVYAHGGMPYFLAPGSDGDKALTEVWMIGFGGRVHIGLGG